MINIGIMLTVRVRNKRVMIKMICEHLFTGTIPTIGIFPPFDFIRNEKTRAEKRAAFFSIKHP